MTVLVHQARYDLRTLLRNPASLFFGLALPVVFLLLLTSFFGEAGGDPRGGADSASEEYYVAAIITLGIVSNTFVNFAIGLTVVREWGILQRVRGTPLGMATFIAGRAIAALAFSTALVVLMIALAWAVFGIAPPVDQLPGLIVAVVVGTIAFCCLGIAISPLIPTEDAAAPIVNGISLPLFFISGTFFPISSAPEWLQTAASIFPVRHLTDAMLTVFDPATTDAGFEWTNAAIMAAWGVAGLLFAMRFFRWTPRRRT
ncbi:MAG: ABC transporter permease [Solirubrobacteraceae bacterium]